MPLPSETQVLIVGAGPAGLAFAISCAQRGIDAVLVDNRGELQGTSRAAWIHARTLEALETLGIVDELLERGLKAPKATVRDTSGIILQADFTSLPDTKHKYVLTISQNETELIMIERLRQLGREVQRPKAVVGMKESNDHYNEVTFESGEVIKARYVIGADGSRSTIRTLAGIRFFTREQFAASPSSSIREKNLEMISDEDWAPEVVLADVHVKNSNIDVSQGMQILIGNLVAWLPMPNDIIRIIIPNIANDPLPKEIDLEWVNKTLRARGVDAQAEDIIWSSHTRVRTRISDKFYIPREGNGENNGRGGVILIGDAAHIHSPAGGQGMNLGLRDAVALGDALQRDLNGDTAALTNWEKDRQKVAEYVLRMTDRILWMAMRTGWLGTFRNLMISVAGMFPVLGRLMALRLSGLEFDT